MWWRQIPVDKRRPAPGRPLVSRISIRAARCVLTRFLRTQNTAESQQSPLPPPTHPTHPPPPLRLRRLAQKKKKKKLTITRARGSISVSLTVSCIVERSCESDATDGNIHAALWILCGRWAELTRQRKSFIRGGLVAQLRGWWIIARARAHTHTHTHTRTHTHTHTHTEKKTQTNIYSLFSSFLYARTLCSFHIAPKAFTSCVPCFPSSRHW